MTYFLFAGDMFVMAFMVGLAIWVSMRSSKASMDQAAQIPLKDEETRG